MLESVRLAMAEVTGAMKEGLLALAVGAGLQVMAAVMGESVAELADPKGRHDLNRVAGRHGPEDGSVTLGNRRVPVRRPRMRASDGSGEPAVPATEAGCPRRREPDALSNQSLIDIFRLRCAPGSA